MSYLTWLKFKATVRDIAEFIGGLLIKFVMILLFIARYIIYAISSLGAVVFGIAFPVGIYLGFKLFGELSRGVPFFETSQWGGFLLFFVVPIVFAFLKEFTKPQSY